MGAGWDNDDDSRDEGDMVAVWRSPVPDRPTSTPLPLPYPFPARPASTMATAAPLPPQAQQQQQSQHQPTPLPPPAPAQQQDLSVVLVTAGCPSFLASLRFVLLGLDGPLARCLLTTTSYLCNPLVSQTTTLSSSGRPGAASAAGRSRTPTLCVSSLRLARRSCLCSAIPRRLPLGSAAGAQRRRRGRPGLPRAS